MRLGHENRCLCTLDGACSRDFIQIYCSCGRIVRLDREEVSLKIRLGKDLECTSCRNRRISWEIDMMNDHFDGILEQEAF